MPAPIFGRGITMRGGVMGMEIVIAPEWWGYRRMELEADMFVNIDGHVVELDSPEDVALFCRCLMLPTPEQVEAAKQAAAVERRQAEIEAECEYDKDGRLVRESAA